MGTTKTHWERIYSTTAERDFSWSETVPQVSLEMLDAAGVTPHMCVLDLGGGDSRLIDQLVTRGMDCLAVLDVSGAALRRAQARLGTAAQVPAWIESDVTGDWTLKPMDVWHDRAVFHFLTAPADRTRYIDRMADILKVNGTAIIATFAPDGPETCSGLPVARYSPETLTAALGERFELVEARPHRHTTPWGAVQSFQYSRLRRVR